MDTGAIKDALAVLDKKLDIAEAQLNQTPIWLVRI